MSKKKNKIIYVDDDSYSIKIFKEIFKNDYEIVSFTTPSNALDYIKNNPKDIHAIISDYSIPHDMDGVEFFIRCQYNIGCDQIMILSTAFDKEYINFNLDKLGVNFIKKPIKKESFDRILKGENELIF